MKAIGEQELSQAPTRSPNRGMRDLWLTLACYRGGLRMKGILAFKTTVETELDE